MYECEGCHCMTFNRVQVANGQKLCSVCEAAYDAVVKASKQHKTRGYNNLTWLIKKDHKTVKAWAEANRFSYSVVEQVLHKRNIYAETDCQVMTDEHFAIVMALCDSGYRDILVNEGYVTHV